MSHEWFVCLTGLWTDKWVQNNKPKMCGVYQMVIYMCCKFWFAEVTAACVKCKHECYYDKTIPESRKTQGPNNRLFWRQDWDVNHSILRLPKNKVIMISLPVLDRAAVLTPRRCWPHPTLNIQKQLLEQNLSVIYACNMMQSLDKWNRNVNYSLCAKLFMGVPNFMTKHKLSFNILQSLKAVFPIFN